jgi:hypothetical protein
MLTLAAAFLAAVAHPVWVPAAVDARRSAIGRGVRITDTWSIDIRLPRFGGISGIAIDGRDLLLLSDAGLLWRVPRPGVPGPVRQIPLPTPCRPGSAETEGADTEALAFAPDGGALRIGIEDANVICAPELDAAVAIPAMASWPRNRGIEALATLPGRGMIAIGGLPLDAAGARPMLWFAGDPARRETTVARMRYMPPPGYQPTDAAFLPDGRLLVLNRRYRAIGGYGSVIVAIPPFAPVDDAMLSGDIVARIEGGRHAANFEGIAVELGADGVVLWLISDNNFFPGRRTRLLRLEIETPKRG